jgi:hypothetical protein
MNFRNHVFHLFTIQNQIHLITEFEFEWLSSIFYENLRKFHNIDK